MHDLDLNDDTAPFNVTGYWPELSEDSSSDSDTDAHTSSYQRRPHANLGGDQSVQNLNQTLVFLDEDESSTSDVETGSADAQDSSPVVCRHLALHYCVCSLDYPDFHPTRESLSILRRASVNTLELVRNDLHEFSRGMHIVCAGEFGVFLRQCFNDMLAEPAQPSGKPGVRAIRAFYISTGNHALAMRLVCWQHEPDGPVKHEVSFYDPNATNQQVQCFVDKLCDFIAKPRTFNLLSFLLPHGEELKKWQQGKRHYFEPRHNRQLQVMLYEVSFSTQHQPNPHLRTDWSASHRTSLYQLQATDQAAYLNALKGTLAEAISAQDTDLLFELNGFDDAVLLHLLRSSHEAGLAQWRELWRRSPHKTQVALLSARTFCGEPWGFLGKKVAPHLLAQWVDMLDSLSPQMAIEVMGATDDQGRVALGLALHSCAQVLQAVDPVLRRCAKTHARDVARLLTHVDQQGLSPLAYKLTPPQEALAIWLGWLREWVPAEERVTALRAADDRGHPAITWAVINNLLPWIDTWGEAVADMPIPDQVRLLQAWDDDEQSALLYAICAGRAAAVRAWGRLAIRLPQKERAEVLCGQSSKGGALLAEPWCEQHTQRPDDPSQDLRPAETVQAQHDALRAWFELLETLDVPARIEVLAARGPDEAPAWLHLARDGLVQEVLLLAQGLGQLIPPEHRPALIERLGFANPQGEAKFLAALASTPSLHRDIATALTHMADWVPPALASALNQALNPH